MKRVKTIQLPINPSIPIISFTPYLENKLTNKPLGENAETYVKAPIYEGITKGKIVRENNNFEPGNSYLTVRIDINKPRNKLVKITAKNNRSVLNNKVPTSHEERKLDRFFEKLANLQNI